MRTILRTAALLICIAAAVLSAGTTHITGTLRNADGTAQTGYVLITWPTFIAIDGTHVAAGTLKVTLGTGGTFAADLYPTDTATPRVWYKAQWYAGQPRAETWTVPTATSAALSTIINTSQPLQMTAGIVSLSSFNAIGIPDGWCITALNGAAVWTSSCGSSGGTPTTTLFDSATGLFDSATGLFDSH